MPRHPRLFVPGATYHVYCRVARGEFVFDDPFEAEEFVESSRCVFDLDGVRVMAWCLMGNHYHLVIQTGATPLWRSMLRVQSAVARGFNRRQRFLGRLRESRYRARVIDSTEYFRQVVSYVHLNPVAAGIVDHPVEYPNSGHPEIVGYRPPRLVDLPSVTGRIRGRIPCRCSRELRLMGPRSRRSEMVRPGDRRASVVEDDTRSGRDRPAWRRPRGRDV